MGGMKYLLVLLSLASCATAVNVDAEPLEDVHVSIQNVLGERVQLLVHCKSGDDDLGEHVVEFGTEYGFDFRTNFWGTTLFFCTLRHGDSTLQFDAFDFRRDRTRCLYQCIWRAMDKGVYGFSDFDKIWQWFTGWTKP